MGPKSLSLPVCALGAVCFTTTVRAQALAGIVPVGNFPVSVAVNPATNKIYVSNQTDQSVTVVDGVSNSASTLKTFTNGNLAVNTLTNKVYAIDQTSSRVAIIDGATNSFTAVPTDAAPTVALVNSATNKVYVLCYKTR